MTGIPEAIAVKALTLGGGAQWERLKRLYTSDRDRLDQLYRELLEEILLEAKAALDRFEAAQRSTNAAFDAEIIRLVDEQKAIRTSLAYIEEAKRSGDKDRIRMLAVAFAGTFRPDVDEELKSRAYRVALQLEPSDVVLLRHFGVSHPPLDAAVHEQQRRRELSGTSPASYIALLSQGCLTHEDFEDPERRDLRADTFRGSGFPHRTTLGMAVLDLVELFDFNSRAG